MSTLNYGWTEPDVGGSSNQWGTILNDTLEAIDVDLKAVDDVAAAALPKTGGTMSGRVTTQTSSMQRVDLGNVSGAVSIDLASGNYFTATIVGNTTFSFTNVPAGALMTGLILRLTNPGAFVLTFPVGTKWPSGVAPTFTAAGVDLLLVITDDAGASFRSSILQKDSR